LKYLHVLDAVKTKLLLGAAIPPHWLQPCVSEVSVGDSAVVVAPAVLADMPIHVAGILPAIRGRIKHR
jgi:hypothetical protein